jgi:WD40 repeat protein
MADWLDSSGRDLLAVDSSGCVFVNQDSNWKEVIELGRLRDGFSSVAWSRGRRTLAVLTQSGAKVLRFNGQTVNSEPLDSVFHSGDCVVVDQNPASGGLVLGTSDGQVVLMDDSGRQVRRLNRPGETLTLLSVSPSGQNVACGLATGQVIVWAITLEGQAETTIGPTANNCMVTAITWSGRKTFYFSRLDGSIFEVDLIDPESRYASDK